MFTYNEEITDITISCDSEASICTNSSNSMSVSWGIKCLLQRQEGLSSPNNCCWIAIGQCTLTGDRSIWLILVTWRDRGALDKLVRVLLVDLLPADLKVVYTLLNCEFFCHIFKNFYEMPESRINIEQNLKKIVLKMVLSLYHK
jgi:hypothetical protein